MKTARKSELNVTFANARGDAVHLGPFTRLIFDGPELKDGDWKLIARHNDHRWELENGTRYSRLECYSPCTIQFETRDDVDHRILAFCDDQLQDWYSFDFGQHYGRMIVLPLDE